MSIITISIVIYMISILAIGTISTNLVFGQSEPNESQGPIGTSQGQGNINAQGSGGGCGAAHCSHDPLGIEDGTGYPGGHGSGGTIISPDPRPSGIDADGGGAGYGQYPKDNQINHCGGGGGGAYDISTGERIGGGVGGGGSCS
jgi:hypothetical protein